MRLNKRGSHVGMILSFVIFITFLVFVYSILEPATKMEKDKRALLDYLKMKLVKKLSTNLTTVVITIDAIGEECVKLENLITEAEIDSHLIIKNEVEYMSLANISESDNSDLLIDRENDGEVFFKIYNSEEFTELDSTAITPCASLGKDTGYFIASIRTNEYIFETKIIDLINEHKENYANLKNELKIPAGSEFGFNFIYNDQTKKGTGEKDILTDVYSKEVPIQYIDKEASISSGIINIQVW